MESRLKKSTELQEIARSLRKKGDALRKAGREENALEAYRDGLTALAEALELLKHDDEFLRSIGPPASGYSADALRELIEIYGALGGMHERLGAPNRSVASYAEGAILEERFEQASTYNRLNAVKFSLLTKTDSLRSYEPKLKALAEFIDSSLRDDKTLSDRGWAWADLGDCLALLDRTVDARKAYATFIAKAEIKSPERTLDVLEKIASKLRSNGDEDAPRLTKAIDALRAGLVAR